MTRLQQFRNYARESYKSVQKLIAAIKEVLSNIKQFVVNIIRIIVTTIRRSIYIIFADTINFVKGVLRLIIDLFRWPFERIALPITGWLADKSGNLYALVETRDEVAIGFFLSMVLFVYVCIYSL